MLCYRIQHIETGLGVFSGMACPDANGKDVSLDCIVSHKSPQHHAGWGNRIGVEFLDKYPETSRFAWDTIDKLYDFVVPGEMDYVLSRGFEIVCYDVTDYVVMPDGQVIFDLSTTKIQSRN